MEPQHLLLTAPDLAPGDFLMMTCAVRDLHRRFPGQYVTEVKTGCAAVWANNPYLSKAAPGNHRRFTINYSASIHNSNQRRAHFATGFVQSLSEKLERRVLLTEMRPDVYMTDAENDPANLPVRGDYWLVVAGGKSDYPAKIWDPVYWQETVNLLRKDFQVVQVGSVEKGHRHKALEGTVDLLGKTDFRQLMALCKHARGIICGVTCTMHLAAAFNRPCVTEDTPITTAEGVRSVAQLVGIPFIALVDGKLFLSPRGFWYTGTKKTLLLSFASGRQLRVTHEHLLMTQSGWKRAADISTGERVVLHNHREFTGKVDPLSADYAKGYLLGNCVGDGTISRKSACVAWFGEGRVGYKKDGLQLLVQAGWHLGRKHTADDTRDVVGFQSMDLYTFAQSKGCFLRGKKELPASAATGSWSYLAGLIAGYIDADGTVTLTNNHGMSIRLASVQLDNLRTIQSALASFGVLSKIYTGRKAGKYAITGNKLCNCKTSYVLHIAGDSVERFALCVPLRNTDKQSRVAAIIRARRRGPTAGRFYDTLSSAQDAGEHAVFDCEVPGPGAFDANGVYAHNCVVLGGGREAWWWEAYTRETWQASAQYPVPDDFVEHAFLHTIGKLPCCAKGGCWKSRVEPEGRGSRCTAPEKGPSIWQPACFSGITPAVVYEQVRNFEAGVKPSTDKIPDRLAVPLFVEQEKRAIPAARPPPKPPPVEITQVSQRRFDENGTSKDLPVTVLLYFTQADMRRGKRCIQTVRGSNPPEALRFVAVLNNVTSAVRSMVHDELLQFGGTAVPFTRRVTRHAAMEAALRHVDTEYAVWLPDTARATHNDWLVRLLAFMRSRDLAAAGRVLHCVPTLRDMQLVHSAPWHAGVAFEDRAGTATVTTVDDSLFFFRTSVIKGLWPVRGAPDDAQRVLLGALIRQAERQVGSFTYGFVNS